MILELKKEEPELFTEDKTSAYREMITVYIRYLGNLRCTGLEFAPLYEGYEKVKTDFSEAKSTAYAKSSALMDDP